MRLSTSNIYEIGDVPVMRELTDDERSNFNAEPLNYILDELIPWHVDDISVYLKLTGILANCTYCCDSIEMHYYSM